MQDFSLVSGGALYRASLRLRLTRPPQELLRRRVLASILVTWLPPAVLTLLAGTFVSGVRVPFLLDLGNLQFLTTVPLLIAAETVAHNRLKKVAAEFLERGLVAPEDLQTFDGIVDRAMRLRDSRTIELALLFVSLTAGYWVWSSFGSLHVDSWYVRTDDGRTALSTAGVWYAFVSLPLARFILLRWYFRLFIWYGFLFRMSRLRLKLNPLHADRAGGLAFLEESIFAFGLVLFAQSTYVGLTVGNHIWHEGATLAAFKLEISLVLAVLVLSVLVPLTFFAPQLVAARLRGTIEYGALASRYVNEFQRKWLGPNEGNEGLLGTGDIQSLGDLANSYTVVEKMRALPFAETLVVRLTVLVALPILPLGLTAMPVDQLVTTLMHLLV